MSEEAFRIVVTVAVILAVIAFLVQSFLIIALFGVARKMQRKVAPLIEKGEAVAASAVPVIERVKSMAEQVSTTLQKAGPVLKKAGSAVDNITTIFASTQQIIRENRPCIAQIVTDGAAIVKSGREQAQDLRDVLRDASTCARARIEQIDRSVNSTLEEVKQIGATVKCAATRPVREVNGIAAAMAAAVSTLVRGSRSSPGHIQAAVFQVPYARRKAKAEEIV